MCIYVIKIFIYDFIQFIIYLWSGHYYTILMTGNGDSES